MKIDGKTKLFALIGSPIGHSISPAMHNTAFKELDLNGCYLAFDTNTDNLEETVRALKRLGARGWNVTMPCKSQMAELCDELSPEAKMIGAVNTIVNTDGHLKGYSTDGIGFFRNVKEQGLNVKGKKVILAGAGGAARSIAAQAVLEGLDELVIYNRTYKKAKELKADIQDTAREKGVRVRSERLSDKEAFKKDLDDAYLFINATSVGMNPELGEKRLLNPDWLRPELAVADIVYNPVNTELLKVAREKGCKTIDGLGMTLWQGAYAFEYWTGEEFPVKAVQDKVFS